MKTAKLENMLKGWFIGNFEPTLLRTNDVEVAVKEYKKGDYEELHYHKTQYTNSNEDTIDSPGEYAESKHFSVGLACFSFEADVVAIVHGDRKTLQQQLKKVWDSSCELELEYDTILSPTVIPYEEFKQYQTVLPYYRNISQEGVVISA